MEKIKNFLKTYWWIWLLLLVISALFLFFGKHAIGSLLYNFLISCFIAFSVISSIVWPLSRVHIISWGIYRLLGLFGIVCFAVAISIIIDNSKSLFDAQNHPLFYFFTRGLFFSILLYSFGEILLYLNNLQKSIKENNEINNSNMTCPTCYGKGFVDLNDIKRLGMEKDWTQGYCKYCNGEGKVRKGITMFKNPLNKDNAPKDFSDILKLPNSKNSI